MNAFLVDFLCGWVIGVMFGAGLITCIKDRKPRKPHDKGVA